MTSPLKITILLSLIYFFAPIPVSMAVGSNTPTAEIQSSQISAPISKKELRKQRKEFRKALKPQGSGLFGNRKFQIGLLALAVGVGFSLLSYFLGGIAIIGFLGVLGIVLGVVFIGWGLLEYIA